MKLLTLLLTSQLIRLTTAVPQPERQSDHQEGAPLEPHIITTPKLILLNGGLHTIEGRGVSTPTPTIWNGGRTTSIFTSTSAPSLHNGGQHWMDESIPPLIITEMEKRDSVPTTVPRQYIASYNTSSILVTICPSEPATMQLPRPYSPSASAGGANASNTTNGSTPTTAPTNHPFPPKPSLHSRPHPSPSTPPTLPRQQEPLPSNSNGTPCTTSPTTTLIPICSTTLSPLAASAITITDCNQLVTFSSEYGYRLIPASATRGLESDSTATQAASRSIETTTTFYVASWYDLPYGSVPSVGVDTVVGSTHISGSSVMVVEGTLTSGDDGIAATTDDSGGPTTVYKSVVSATSVVVVEASASGMTTLRV